MFYYKYAALSKLASSNSELLTVVIAYCPFYIKASQLSKNNLCVFFLFMQLASKQSIDAFVPVFMCVVCLLEVFIHSSIL